MTNERIDNALDVIDYAIENQISVYEASQKCGYASSYVKNVKRDILSRYEKGTLDDEFYDKFMSAYEKYESNLISHKKNDLKLNFTETKSKYEDGELIEEKVLIEKNEKQVTKYFFEIPPTDEDIKNEFGIDGINTILSNYWVKGKSKGYFVSANIKVLNNNFYSLDELNKKIKSLLPNYTSNKLPSVSVDKSNKEKALIILISDDHAGAVNELTIFNNEEYKPSTYTKRLLKIIDQVKKLESSFDKCYIISAGDQINSWSNNTTRGGHEVKSLSNKEQFDSYVNARKIFYDELFKSKLSNNYEIIDMENSNHSGLGLSYMANRALGFYIEGKYPQVIRKSILLPIDYIEYGKHIIGIAHGKDEKFMRAPMPINLDKKTDLYLLEYFNHQGFSPKDKYITFYKGDLHTFNLNHGKFGRYVNLPSVMGSSDYIELNFGKSKPGAIIEIIEKESPNIKTIPVWF